MANAYPQELKTAIDRLETMVSEYRRKNHAAPVRLIINRDEEEQSWLMWAAQIVDITVELSDKSKTRVV